MSVAYGTCCPMSCNGSRDQKLIQFSPKILKFLADLTKNSSDHLDCFPKLFHLLKRSIFADLLHCTEEPNVSIPQLANLLLDRLQHPNWIVVYKALVSIHHLMLYGNEVCFLVLKYVASITRRSQGNLNKERYHTRQKRVR